MWGDDGSGPLGAAELNDFAAQGYLVRPDTVDSDALGPLGNELERLAAELDSDDPGSSGNPAVRSGRSSRPTC